MASNSLSGSVHGGQRYGGQVISSAGRSGGKAKTIGQIVQRTGNKDVFVYQGRNQVGYQRDSGTSPSRYPQRMPSGYVTTRSQAQGQAGS